MESLPFHGTWFHPELSVLTYDFFGFSRNLFSTAFLKHSRAGCRSVN